MGFERRDLATRGNIPKFDHPIGTAHGESFAIVSERQGQNRSSVAAKRVNLSGRDVPQLNGLIPAADGE